MKKICLVIFLFLFAIPCFAATYYVDGTLGADCAGGGGTSYRVANRDCAGSGGEVAWNTVAESETNASSAGDIVYIRTGTYGEQVNWDSHSGSDPNYITFEACHDGSDGDCSDSDDYEVVTLAYSSSTPYGIEYVSWVKWKGLIFDSLGYTNGANHTVTVWGDNDNLYFEDCTFKGCSNYGEFYVSNGSGNVSNITWDSCTFTDPGGSGEGLYISGESDWVNTLIGFNILNCTFTETDEAIQIVANGKMEPSTVLIDGCEIYGNGMNAGWALFDLGINGLIIRNNKIYDNDNNLHAIAGIYLSNGSNTEIYNNIIYNNDGTNPYSSAIRVSNQATTSIYNNTIVEQGGGGVGFGVSFNGSNTGVNIKNNIFSNIAGDSISSDAGACENNIFHNIGGSDNCDDANNATGDPLFNSVGADEYWLRVSSPAIGEGVDLGNGLLYGIDPSSSWPNSVTAVDQDDYGDWEIGAYIFDSPQTDGVSGVNIN